MLDEGNRALDIYRLVLEAVRNPDSADTSGLLSAASALLNTLHEGDPVCVPLARKMADAAMHYAVFGSGLDALGERARAFWSAFHQAYPA
jgi:hypothetical protein